MTAPEWAHRRKLLAAYWLAETASITDAVNALSRSGDEAAANRLPDLMRDLMDASTRWRRASGDPHNRSMADLIAEARRFCTDNVNELDPILEGRSFVEMEDLHFVDPPLLSSYDWEAVSRKLRNNPGRWAQLGDEPIPVSVINALRQGNISRMRPTDGFKVRSRKIRNEDGVRVADLYLRYDEPEDE